MNLPCATSDRARCPLVKHAAASAEGAAVWGLVEACPTAVKVGELGRVIGFDWLALMAAAGALGVPTDALARLLPPLELGMLEGRAAAAAGEGVDAGALEPEPGESEGAADA